MREITKTITIPIDGTPRDFRLTKLDAFSGASLLRMLSRIPEPLQKPEPSQIPETSNRITGSESEGPPQHSPALMLFAALSDSDLRSLMTACLQHVEVLLPAGWISVMTRGEWSWSELEHDTAVCLKLTLEEVLWTLDGFFGGGGSASRSEIPAS